MLASFKIWSMVRDEFVAADEDALFTVPCSDVASFVEWSDVTFSGMGFLMSRFFIIFCIHRDVI